MKALHMNAKIKKAFSRVKKARCVIQDGNEEATITQQYVDSLNALIREIVNSTVTPSWKGRRPIGWLVRAPELHINQLPFLVPETKGSPTAKEQSDALSTLTVNIQMDCEALRRVATRT